MSCMNSPHDKLISQIRAFMHTHFERNYDGSKYIFFTDILDFILEHTEFNIIKIKQLLLNSDEFIVENGKVYGITCITDDSINREIVLDISSSSSDSDCLEDYDST